MRDPARIGPLVEGEPLLIYISEVSRIAVDCDGGAMRIRYEDRYSDEQPDGSWIARPEWEIDPECGATIPAEAFGAIVELIASRGGKGGGAMTRLELLEKIADLARVHCRICNASSFGACLGAECELRAAIAALDAAPAECNECGGAGAYCQADDGDACGCRTCRACAGTGRKEGR
jgi:hypothetical protein